MQTVITLTELAERWGVAQNSIRNMEQDGKLHRLQNMPGCRYSMAEVYQLENIGLAAKGLTAWERKQLEEKLKAQDELIARYERERAQMMELLMGGLP